MHYYIFFFFFFFFNDTATTEIYTLSYTTLFRSRIQRTGSGFAQRDEDRHRRIRDRKSTRLNSSHVSISYAVFCLKKKKKNNKLSIDKKKTSTKYTKMALTCIT